MTPVGTADLVGSSEAARMLGRSPRFVHRLVIAGKLEPVVIAPGGFNGSFMFNRADIEALVAAREEKAS
jgi:hypothetical protein